MSKRRCSCRIGEPEDHIDPLFFDAQRGDLRVCIGLDPCDARGDWLIAAPSLQSRGCAGLYKCGVLGQKFSDDFKVGGIAHLKERCADGDHALTFLQDA